MAITHTAELSRVQQLGLRVVGAGLLIATGGIHLDLYLTGYNTIPTIGWLFLLQVITGFALGLAVLATGSRLVAAAGAGFALATLGGYLLSIWVGLFGFKEVRTTAGIVAGIIEVVAFVALAMLAALPGAARHRAQQPHSPLLDRLQDGVPGAAWSRCCCWASRWQGRAARRRPPPPRAATCRWSRSAGRACWPTARA
jgi:hypothetical protein